jgi:hypothetical protein
MEHVAELAVHSYLEQVTTNKKTMSEENIRKIADDVAKSLRRQFCERRGGTGGFTLRASNIGRAACQLWYQKNHPEKEEPLHTTFLVRMVFGDMVEALFKGLLREANVTYKEPKRIQAKIGTTDISGEYDLIVDGAVDDIKSTSPWSYNNKFTDGKNLEKDDPFGYVGQLAVYSTGANVPAGGWWVINQASGQFKYVAYESDTKEVVKKLAATADKVNNNIFERCFKPEAETFRSKLTGNHKLIRQCSFCSFKHDCWKGALSEEPSRVSAAKNPPIVFYVDMEKVNDRS